MIRRRTKLNEHYLVEKNVLGRDNKCVRKKTNDDISFCAENLFVVKLFCEMYSGQPFAISKCFVFLKAETVNLFLWNGTTLGRDFYLILNCIVLKKNADQ